MVLLRIRVSLLVEVSFIFFSNHWWVWWEIQPPRKYLWEHLIKSSQHFSAFIWFKFSVMFGPRDTSPPLWYLLLPRPSKSSPSEELPYQENPLQFLCRLFILEWGGCYTHSIWKFPGQGSNLCHSCNLSHSRDNGQASSSSFFFFAFFLGPHPQHMEVPRLGVLSEPQLPAYATATATTAATATMDRSHVCNLHHSSRQCRIPSPLSKARDWTYNLMVPSQVHFCCTRMGTPFFFFLCIFYIKITLL